MVYRLVLDENVEHEAYHRLKITGTTWNTSILFGKGVGDRSIADYSRETDRIIVTYDDFALELADEEYRAAFSVHDDSLPVKTVADIIPVISKQYPQSEVTGLEYVGDEWL